MPSSSWPIVVGLIAIAFAAFWYDAHNANAANDAAAHDNAVAAQAHATR